MAGSVLAVAGQGHAGGRSQILAGKFPGWMWVGAQPIFRMVRLEASWLPPVSMVSMDRPTVVPAVR